MLNKWFVVNIVAPIILLTGILFFMGCGAVRVEHFDVDLPSSAKAPIPMRVGLYLSPAFLKYHYAIEGAPVYIVSDGLGEGAKRALKEVFEEVVVLDVMSPDAARHDIKAIVSPDIIETRILPGGVVPGGIAFTCKWTVLSPDGKILYVNTVTGFGTDNSFLFKTRLTESMTLAAKDMYQKFITHMLSTKWWEGIR